MSSKRSAPRYFALRAVVSLAGDLAAGVAVATACSWIIESAALGIFLGFLIWLLGVVVALALSQHVVHPTVQWALADDKLDRGLAAMASLQGATARLAGEIDLAEWLGLLRQPWPPGFARRGRPR